MEILSLIAEGGTADVFELRDNKVLKLFKAEYPKTMAEREFNLSLAISKQFNFIPKVYQIVQIDNRYGIVYEKIDGVTMLKVVISKPWRVKKEAQHMAELHKLIQVKIKDILPQYKTVFKDNIFRTTRLTDDIKLKLYNYVDGLSNDNILCHGDFHPDNILISKNKTFIIDWLTATRGNSLADVARTSIVLKFTNASGKTSIENQLIQFFRKKFLKEYINHYTKITNTTTEQIEEWELPIAALRLCETPSKKEEKYLLDFINAKLENLKYL